MKDTYTYQIGDNLYVNLTNRCTNRCTFCVRREETYEGYSLWLKGDEPTAEAVLEEIGDPKRYLEIVFCGYGEPTYRLDALLRICDEVHRRGGSTRLNTNGHGSAIAKKNIAPLLAKKLNGINISLNAPTAEEYEALCRPQIGNAFGEMLSFSRALKAERANAWFSVVDCIGEEKIEACRRLAEEIGLPLRVRPLIG